MKKLLFVALCGLIPIAFASADDWPQFRGPQRNGISKETGLLKDWPKDGPPLAWKVTGLGGGFSAPSVAEGRIFGMSYRNGNQVLWALDEKEGKEQWATNIAPISEKVGYGVGPRCTPTVDGDLVYGLGTGGELVCLKVADGKEVWHKNLEKDFGGHFMAGWG
jgi:outer membrane protein assembly factor BamB